MADDHQHSVTDMRKDLGKTQRIASTDSAGLERFGSKFPTNIVLDAPTAYYISLIWKSVGLVLRFSGVANVVVGRRRELLGLYRQPTTGFCCPSGVRYAWHSFIGRLHHCLDYTVQAAGPMYIILAFSLICAVIYLFLTCVLPSMHDLSSWQGMVHLLIAGWLAFNVLFNYFHCIFTNPGNLPSVPVLDAGTEVIPGASYEMDVGGPSTPFARWCKRCRKPKPPMTHHCHICKRCILKMDHHCPWMHNCIGFYNYRFFFIFLFYMWVGCLYSSIMASIPLFRLENEDDEDNTGVLFSFVLSLAVFLSLSFLLGWHIYLVLTAQTTIDFYGNRVRQQEAHRVGEAWSNEFDLGRLQNLRNVLDVGGQHWWLWIILPTNARPKGDGIHFPVKEIVQLPSSSSSSQPRLTMCDILRQSDTDVGRSSVPDRGNNLAERKYNDGPWLVDDLV